MTYRYTVLKYIIIVQFPYMIPVFLPYEQHYEYPLYLPLSICDLRIWLVLTLAFHNPYVNLLYSPFISYRLQNPNMYHEWYILSAAFILPLILHHIPCSYKRHLWHTIIYHLMTRPYVIPSVFFRLFQYPIRYPDDCLYPQPWYPCLLWPVISVRHVFLSHALMYDLLSALMSHPFIP